MCVVYLIKRDAYSYPVRSGNQPCTSYTLWLTRFTSERGDGGYTASQGGHDFVRFRIRFGANMRLFIQIFATILAENV